MNWSSPMRISRPRDTFVDAAALRMQVVGEPDQVMPVHQEVQAEVDRAESMPKPLGSIERMEFYERAKQA